jgi:hypothetical protein
MAIDPNIVELINADIDGDISPADKDTLGAMMAESPDAQAMHAELSGLSSSLDELPDLDAPPYLIHTIMAEVPKNESQDRGDFLRGLFAAPALRYAAMFVAGSVLTLSLVSSDQVSERAFNDVTGLVGTISSEVPVGPGIQTLQIDRTDVAGHITVRSSGPLLIVDFDLVSNGPIDIVASYSDQSVWFNGFAQLESPGASISAETGRISMKINGKRRYALYLHNAGDRNISIHLRFMSDGEVVYDTDIQYTQPGQPE